MANPTLGWTIGGAAVGSTYAPLPVQATQASLTADYLPMYSASAGGTVAINLDNLLGISSQVVSVNDPQTITQKTFNNTNAYTAKDTSFTLQNATDTTKQAQFLLSGLTTGTTRIYTLPNYNATLATLAGTETFTNKTLTAPTITNPVITGATISADAVTGASVSTSGTIYGLTVAAGVITTSGYVNSTALQQNAVQANQLATNAILLGSASSTTSFTTTSATSVQVTGLTASVTIPAGGRKVRVIVTGDYFTISTAGTVAVSIWDGTVGSGTQLAETQTALGGGGTNLPYIAMALVSPSAGSKTYNVGFKTSAGTGTMAAASTAPMILTVEVL